MKKLESLFVSGYIFGIVCLTVGATLIAESNGWQVAVICIAAIIYAIVTAHSTIQKLLIVARVIKKERNKAVT